MKLTKQERIALASRTYIEQIANDYVEKFYKIDRSEEYPLAKRAFMINSTTVGVFLTSSINFTAQGWKLLLCAVPLRDLVTYNSFKRMAQIDIDRRRKQEEAKRDKEYENAMAIIKRGRLL